MSKKLIIIFTISFLIAFSNLAWSSSYSSASYTESLITEQIVYHAPTSERKYSYYHYIPESALSRDPVRVLLYAHGSPKINTYTEMEAFIRDQEINRILPSCIQYGYALVVMVTPRNYSGVDKDFLMNTQNMVRWVMFDNDFDKPEYAFYKRPDLEFVKVIEDFISFMSQNGYNVYDRVFMTGFSAGGVQSQRFPILRPDKIAATAIGGAPGFLYPVATWNNIPLNYHVGINDIGQISGNTYSPAEFAKIPHFVFVGGSDTNDALYHPDMYDNDQSDIIKTYFGANLQERAQVFSQYISTTGKSTVTIYPGIAHDYTPQMLTDTFVFFDSIPTNTVALYFPHIATTDSWETEIAIINTSGHAITGTLRPFGDSGAAVSTALPVTLAPHGRRQVTVSQEFTSPGSIGYLVFESGSSSLKGYSKLFRAGNDRVALPAVGRINSGTILMPHLASTGGWQTEITLVNTTASPISANLEFSTGQTSTVTLGAGERRVFTVADLFGGQPQEGIISGLIRNGAGLIGAELFSSGSLLSGVLLEDKTAQTIYYPHVASSGGWWTGMVAYNPSTTPCTLTVTPYSEGGVALTAQTEEIPGGQKYIGTADTLQLPAETAWMQISGTSETTGFELFGSGSQLAGYTGVGIRGKEGVFAKIEKQGWTGIAFVNTEDTTATVTLTAYGDSGAVVATATKSVPGHQKVVDLAESLFSQDISTATYLSYSSDKEVVGFQLNGSADGTILDGLPGL